MNSRDFLKAGHWPTLLAAFFYFDMSFMVWILLGPLAVQIAGDLKLDPGPERVDGGAAGPRRRAASRRRTACLSIVSGRSAPG